MVGAGDATGGAIARRFAREGYTACITRRNVEKLDGLVADMTICVLSVLRYPDRGLATLNQPMTVEPIGIAVPADDPQLLNLLDNYLDALEEVGYMKELRRVWLSDDAWLAALP